MAFARIITRSHQYAQQLALDLLARGYAVEIVSPDAVPETPADLELRVEAAGSETQGRVTEIREGKQARSIEYLQRLKPMMADLLRRWPAGDKISSGKEVPDTSAISFNAEPEYSDMELPSSQDHGMSEPGPVAPAPDLDSARLIPPTDTQKSESVFSITGEPMLWAESETERGGSEVWFWRAAVGFATVALLILVFGMALRRPPATPAASASVAESTQSASATAPRPAVPKATALAPSASLSPLPAKPAAIAATTPTSPSSPRVKPSAAIRRVKGTQFQEVVNGDTTVTYFNAKPEVSKATAARQESGIKHYSDLN